MSWSFTILSDYARIVAPDHLKRWQAHVDDAESTHVFFHPLLVTSWMETYLPIRNLTPIFVWAQGPRGIVAMLPLVLWKRNWKNAFERLIVPMGFSDFDYHDPIFSREPDSAERSCFWKELTDTLAANYRFDRITLDGMAHESGEAWEPGEMCPYLKLDNLDSGESLLAFLKTSLRGDIRRQIRRINEIGEMKLVSYTDAEMLRAETFGRFMHAHSQRWPNAYKAPQFHANMIKAGLAAGVVDFTALMAGETELAWHLGFSYKGRYYYYMPAGNPEFLKYSPVKIHLFKLIERAILNGIEIYDHLRGEENYKDGWSDGHQTVHAQSIISGSASTAAKRKLLKLRAILPPPAPNRQGHSRLAA